MHIPDGFLSTETWSSTWIVSVGAIGYCLRRTEATLRERTVPLMGVMAAFIFAAQMLNFPVAAGTSGHLLGGVLASVLLGPYASAVVISVVLIAQCFIFQDGGVTVLGANILNMALIGAVGGYACYVAIRRMFSSSRGILIGASIAAWLSVVVAAAACAIELSLSGTTPIQVALPAMVGVHTLIGVGEGLITWLILSFVLKVRPDLLYSAEGTRR